MVLAGYKTISIMLLTILVALAGVSPVFAQDEAFITLAPAAACRGERVIVSLLLDDIVGGGISVAAVSPSAFRTFVLSSDPVGLVANPECSDLKAECTFVVSESASCGHYTVIVTQVTVEQLSRIFGSAQFDVSGPCCAVGGCVQPVNTFALLSPWLAAIGLVGCIGTAVVVAKKREK